jgi:hypothetical protein
MPTPIYTFSPRTVISSTEVNANFELLEECLEKAGDEMEGTLGTLLVQPVTTNAYDLGAAAALYRALYVVSLKLSDSNNTHLLSVIAGSNLTANRTLTINTGDSDRTLEWPFSLANGGTGSSLADPGADRILFWDDSAGAVTWLTIGDNLSIVGTTISSTAGSGGGLTVTGTDNRIVRMNGTGAIQDSGITVDDSDNVTGVQRLTIDGGFVSAPPAAIALSSGNNNNLALSDYTTIEIDASAAADCVITGLTNGTDGRLVFIANVGTEAFTLAGESASSTAANRIATDSAAIGPGSGTILFYSGGTSRWYIVGGAA